MSSLLVRVLKTGYTVSHVGIFDRLYRSIFYITTLSIAFYQSILSTVPALPLYLRVGLAQLQAVPLVLYCIVCNAGCNEDTSWRKAIVKVPYLSPVWVGVSANARLVPMVPYSTARRQWWHDDRIKVALLSRTNPQLKYHIVILSTWGWGGGGEGVTY